MSALVFHHPDSFALMAEDPVPSFDVIITDPPYAAAVQENLCSGSLVGKKSVPKYDLPFAPLSVAQHSWLQDAIVLARRWVITFCAVEDFGRFQDRMGKAYVRGAVWYKSNAMGQLTADRPATSYEGIACLHNTTTKKRWNGKGSYGIWQCPGTRGLKDRHPNEKPINLALKLVALFSERGETVFDPFCGSGAIGQACMQLGRHYVGIDNDPAWVAKSKDRLARDYEQISDETALALCRMNTP